MSSIMRLIGCEVSIQRQRGGGHIKNKVTSWWNFQDSLRVSGRIDSINAASLLLRSETKPATRGSESSGFVRFGLDFASISRSCIILL
jgi:hypothetical protein